MCIYMFIFTELIEETGRTRVDFGMGEYFCPGSDKFEFWKKIRPFEEFMT